MATSKRFNAVSSLIAALIVLFPLLCFAGQKPQPENKTTSEDVKRETTEAIQSIKSYSIKQKDQAVKKVEQILNRTDDRLDRLQRNLDNEWDEMDQASREKARETFTALRKMRNHLSEWYGGLKNSSANAWDQTKKGFVEGYESLSRTADKVENKFSAAKGNKKDVKK